MLSRTHDRIEKLLREQNFEFVKTGTVTYIFNLYKLIEKILTNNVKTILITIKLQLKK